MKTVNLAIAVILLVLSINASATKNDPGGNCLANPKWFSNPSLPKEVKKSAQKGTSSNFCDFYQFSWQAFLYLMSEKSDKRIFENNNEYPILEFNASGKPVDSCNDTTEGERLFVNLDKSNRIPEIIQQAGDGATIYDQNGNVVYYEVRFSRNMCNVNSIKKRNNFPDDTVEMKMAWRVISSAEKDQYVHFTTDIGSQKNVLLGLVGFHLAIATEDHPEFVWATFEHKANDPDCNMLTNGDWSFTSKTCTDISPITPIHCDFNHAHKMPPSAITGNPTEICRQFAYGTGLHDPHALENLAAVISLNANVNELMKGDFSVLKNYFNVGALWVDDINKSSAKNVPVTGHPKQTGSDISNQRGSLRLANTVAETTFQNVDINPNTNDGFASNCFGCHNYVGKKETFNKNVTSGSLSHIFDDIAAGKGECLDVQAGPIYNEQQAKDICPKTCTNSSNKLFKWNGQWTTTKLNVMSVCGCCPG